MAALHRRALGRWELLSWLNDFLCLDQSKVEECADGVAYCQLVDAVFPGKIPLHKLVWDARGKDDRMKNMRILEKVMRECGMSKPVQAEKIASGSFPENLALLQFLHTYIQRNCPGVHLQYNAYQRRVEAMELAGARRDAGNEGGGRKRSNDRLRPGERGAERDSLYMSSMGSPAGSPNKEGQGQSEEGELSGHGLDEFALLHSSPARSLKPSLPQPMVLSSRPSPKRLVADRYAGVLLDSDDEYGSGGGGDEVREGEREAEWDDERGREWESHMLGQRQWEHQHARQRDMDTLAASRSPTKSLATVSGGDRARGRGGREAGTRGQEAGGGGVSVSADELEMLAKLDELLKAELSSRLLAITARSTEIQELLQERDWYLGKLNSIQATAEEYGDCYSSRQIQDIVLAPLSCMEAR